MKSTDHWPTTRNIEVNFTYGSSPRRNENWTMSFSDPIRDLKQKQPSSQSVYQVKFMDKTRTALRSTRLITLNHTQFTIPVPLGNFAETNAGSEESVSESSRKELWRQILDTLARLSPYRAQEFAMPIQYVHPFNIRWKSDLGRKRW